MQKERHANPQNKSLLCSIGKKDKAERRPGKASAAALFLENSFCPANSRNESAGRSSREHQPFRPLFANAD